MELPQARSIASTADNTFDWKGGTCAGRELWRSPAAPRPGTVLQGAQFVLVRRCAFTGAPPGRCSVRTGEALPCPSTLQHTVPRAKWNRYSTPPRLLCQLQPIVAAPCRKPRTPRTAGRNLKPRPPHALQLSGNTRRMMLAMDGHPQVGCRLAAGGRPPTAAMSPLHPGTPRRNALLTAPGQVVSLGQHTALHSTPTAPCSTCIPPLAAAGLAARACAAPAGLEPVPADSVAQWRVACAAAAPTAQV